MGDIICVFDGEANNIVMLTLSGKFRKHSSVAVTSGVRDRTFGYVHRRRIGHTGRGTPASIPLRPAVSSLRCPARRLKQETPLPQ